MAKNEVTHNGCRRLEIEVRGYHESGPKKVDHWSSVMYEELVYVAVCETNGDLV